MRADIRKQNIFTTHGLAHIPQYFLWLDQAPGVIILVNFKFSAHLPARCGLLGEVKNESATGIDALVEHPQGMCKVADNLGFRVVVFVYLGG